MLMLGALPRMAKRGWQTCSVPALRRPRRANGGFMIDDFAKLNPAHSAAFTAPYPVRSTPEARITFAALVNIEVTAYRR